MTVSTKGFNHSEQNNPSFFQLIINVCHILVVSSSSRRILACRWRGFILYVHSGMWEIVEKYIENWRSSGDKSWAGSAWKGTVRAISLESPKHVITESFVVASLCWNRIFYTIPVYSFILKFSSSPVHYQQHNDPSMANKRPFTGTGHWQGNK